MDVEIKQDGQDINNADVIETKSEYNAGDIVWAKLAGCPFWPSIVTYDPTTRLCIKTSGTGEKKNFSLHVRFCNYYGQRSWAKIIEKYCPKEDLILKYPDCMACLKKNKKETVLWNAAVGEADYLMTLDRKERMLHFCSVYELDYSKELFPSDSSDTVAQDSNTTSTGFFHDTISVLIAKDGNIQNVQNIQNNDDDLDEKCIGDRIALSEQIDLLINKYGFSNNNDQQNIEPEPEIDLDLLVPFHRSCVPNYLMRKIHELEESLEEEPEIEDIRRFRINI